MDCPQCGYHLQPFEDECPKCARLKAQGKTVEQVPPPVQPPATQVAGTTPGNTAPVSSARQWTCPKCGLVNTKSMVSCDKCGTPNVPQVNAGTGSQPSAGRFIFSLIVFVLVFLALGFFNDTTRAYFTRYSVVYRNTLRTAEGDVLLIGVSIRNLNVPQSTTQEIVANESTGGKYAGVQVGYFKPMNLPMRNRWGRRDQAARDGILKGTAGELYSCSTDGKTITRRLQGVPFEYQPPTDEQNLDRTLGE